MHDDLQVSTTLSTVAEAKARGAMALFGEVYGDVVRVVEIGSPWSLELCGGTHVERSSQIGNLVLLGESSIGSGVRRIESYVGLDAFSHLAAERALVENLSGLLKVPAKELPGRVAGLVERLRVAEKELAQLRAANVLSSAGSLVDKAERFGEVTLVAAELPAGTAANDLRALAGDVRGRLGGRPGVVALFAGGEGSVPFVVALTDAAVSRGLDAGALVKLFAPAVGGRGGGRRELAQGSGTDATGIGRAIDLLRGRLTAPEE